jgi:hypothetical protein
MSTSWRGLRLPLLSTAAAAVAAGVGAQEPAAAAGAVVAAVAAGVAAQEPAPADDDWICAPP